MEHVSTAELHTSLLTEFAGVADSAKFVTRRDHRLCVLALRLKAWQTLSLASNAATLVHAAVHFVTPMDRDLSIGVLAVLEAVVDGSSRLLAFRPPVAVSSRLVSPNHHHLFYIYSRLFLNSSHRCRLYTETTKFIFCEVQHHDFCSI